MLGVIILSTTLHTGEMTSGQFLLKKSYQPQSLIVYTIM